jgi:hypothetical protein
MEYATWKKENVSSPDHIQELHHILGSHKVRAMVLRGGYVLYDQPIIETAIRQINSAGNR